MLDSTSYVIPFGKGMTLFYKHTWVAINEGRCSKSLFNNMLPSKMIIISLHIIHTHTHTFFLKYDCLFLDYDIRDADI